MFSRRSVEPKVAPCALNYYARKVMMVKPTNFFFNAETAADNEFMNNNEDVDMEEGGDEINKTSGTDFKAQQQFEGLVSEIESRGIEVVKYEQQHRELPDSVFPNNWISTHYYPGILDKKLVWVYPMKAVTRQREVNPQIISDLVGDSGHTIDFTPYNELQKSLEGTGVLIFDPVNLKIYAGLSQRWEPSVLEHFLSVFNSYTTEPFKLVTFNAMTKSKTPIYHTNVMMAMLIDHAVICLEAIADEDEKARVIEEITSPELNIHPRSIVDISLDEVNKMWGNVISVVNKDDKKWVIMSKSAYEGFRPEYKELLEQSYEVIYSDVSTIEEIGGGSARCMVAEVFDEITTRTLSKETS